jgi:hypothetical protein
VLIAAAESKDGRKLLVLGLHAENIDRLKNDMPIYKRLDGKQGSTAVPGLEEWDLTILGPEDLERFVAAVTGVESP